MLSASTETASGRPLRSRIGPRRGSRLIVRSLWRAAWRAKGSRPRTWSWTRRTTITTPHRQTESATSISRSRTCRSRTVGDAGGSISSFPRHGRDRRRCARPPEPPSASRPRPACPAPASPGPGRAARSSPRGAGSRGPPSRGGACGSPRAAARAPSTSDRARVSSAGSPGSARRRARGRPPAPPRAGPAATGRGWSGDPPPARSASCRWPWGRGPGPAPRPSRGLPLDRAQARAAGARVARRLLVGGPNRLAREHAEARGRRGTEGLLHLAVLEAVERDHDEPAAGREPAGEAVERGAQPLQLAVHVNAQRLERQRRGIDAAAARPPRRRAHDLGEVLRAAERSAPPPLDDAAGDAPRGPLLAVAVDDVGQLGLGHPVHDLGGRDSAARVHAHVERPVALQAEAALGAVELHRADAEVEQEDRKSTRLN